MGGRQERSRHVVKADDRRLQIGKVGRERYDRPSLFDERLHGRTVKGAGENPSVKVTHVQKALAGVDGMEGDLIPVERRRCRGASQRSHEIRIVKLFVHAERMLQEKPDVTPARSALG